MLPKGFLVNGLHCGIAKKKDKKDLALFYSDRPAAAAGMFTGNIVRAAPVIVSERHLKISRGTVRAIVANSGCANACTGERGLRDAETMCRTVAGRCGLNPPEVMVASTGVIGNFQSMPAVTGGIEVLAGKILAGDSDPAAAVAAIMTTDTLPKTARRTVTVGGKKVTVWGCAKGSGMIHPNLKALHATMFAFILTDAAASRTLLDRMLSAAVEESFNCVSVDGDTSTNDTVLLLANGAAGNKTVTAVGKDYAVLAAAVNGVCVDLAKMMARDGEGATRLVEVRVLNAASREGAKRIAATIATSPLVKTAIFGNDANWGRILAAAGRAGVNFNPDNAEVRIGNIVMARNGMAVKFSEAKAKQLLQKQEVIITLDLKSGKHSSHYYTCDFSFDYIKINASYRS